MARTIPADQSTEEIGHFIRRARQERELALRTAGSSASQAHLQRAAQYEGLLMRADMREDDQRGAADYEISNFTMSSQRLFPFYQHRSLPSAYAR